MRLAAPFAVLIAITLGATAVVARTWFVIPDSTGDAPNIQAGIDSASAADTVLLATGTFTGPGNKYLSFNGKAITVLGEFGPDSCVIDCENDGRGFTFNDSETELSVLEGITITNGLSTFGTGILCLNGNPVIINCKLVGNTATDAGGGGMYISQCDPYISNCTIIGNDATDWMGGGVSFINSNATITNSFIDENNAFYGGGIHCEWSDPIIFDCSISDNTSTWRGGGINCDRSGPVITNCTIAGNEADSGGGVAGTDQSSPVITNCLIAVNTVTANGGGMRYEMDCMPMITNCTITGNTAQGGFGGAVYCSDQSDPTITNSILWNDSPEEIGGETGGTIVNYSDVAGGWPGEGNDDAIPEFIDPDGPDDDPDTWEDNSYRLSSDSPCIDAGNNAAVPPGVVTDRDGNPRIVDGDGNATPIVDMGAYEFQIFTEVSSSEDVVTAAPSLFGIDQNAPNPFNPATTIRYWLARPGPVFLAVHDVRGRMTAVLLDRDHEAGEFVQTWDGRDRSGREVPAGIYFACLRAGDFTAARKMLLLR